MASSKLYLLPVVTFVLFILTFIISFTIAVCLGHVQPDFPYISDTGTYSPESCIFGLLLNFGTLLLTCTTYVRFRQAAHLCVTYGLGSKVSLINKIAAIIGFLSSVGINIVANFQESNVLFVHMIGAVLGFGGAVIFLIMQTILSYKLYPLASTAKWLLHLRSFMTGLVTLTFIFCMLCGSIAFFQFKGKLSDMPKWRKEDGGWELHLVSTATEWVTAFFIMCYILSFTGEFKRIHITEPHVEVEPADFRTTVIDDRESVRWPA